MNALNSELIAIALAIGGFFLFGYIYLMWNELSLEFKKRRDLRKLGKENRKKRESEAPRLARK